MTRSRRLCARRALPDFSHVLDTDDDGAQVVPIFPSRNMQSSSVHGIYAAQKNYAKVYWKSFPIVPAFAMTDFKLQGRTLSKLVISSSVNPAGADRRWTSSPST